MNVVYKMVKDKAIDKALKVKTQIIKDICGDMLQSMHYMADALKAQMDMMSTMNEGISNVNRMMYAMRERIGKIEQKIGSEDKL